MKEAKLHMKLQLYQKSLLSDLYTFYVIDDLHSNVILKLSQDWTYQN